MTRGLVEERLRAFGIDAHTRHNLFQLRPVLATSVDRVVADFYAHFSQLPTARRHFTEDVLQRLKPRQCAHWLDMFECRFDERYVANAIRIGEVHFRQRVPARLYLAGQSHFQCSLIRLAADKFGASRDLPAILAAVTRVIALDTDLALSAYTRAYWSMEKPAAASSADEVWV